MPAIADPPVFPAWYGRLSEADRATLRRTIEAVDLRYRASVEWLGFRVRNYCLVAPDSPTVKTLQEQTDNLQSVANQAASKASQALQRVQATEQRLAAIEARMDAVAAAASRPAGK